MAHANFSLSIKDMDLIHNDLLFTEDDLDDILLNLSPSTILVQHEIENDSTVEPPTKNSKKTQDILREYVEGNRNKNTTGKTMRDTQRFMEFLSSQNELRPLLEIPPREMDVHLGSFLKDMKQKNAKDYEPDTITSFFRSVDRYLKDKGYPVSITKDDDFRLSRNVLASKRKSLKAAGGGNRINRADPLSPEEEELLWERKTMGAHAAMPLLRALWFLTTKLMGHCGRQESRQLQWGDISVAHDEQGRFLSFKERTTKTRQGEGSDARDAPPRAYENAVKPERCPVELCQLYSSCRPADMLKNGSHFYLAVNHMSVNKENKKSWFKSAALGKNKLGQFMKDMSKEAGLQGHFCNHSVRKTSLTNLLQAGVPPTLIKHISGHKNEQSIGHYATASKAQVKTMNEILQNPGKPISNPICPKSIPSHTLSKASENCSDGNNKNALTPNELLVLSSVPAVCEIKQNQTAISGLLHNAILNNCTLNISYTMPGPPNNQVIPK